MTRSPSGVALALVAVAVVAVVLAADLRGTGKPPDPPPVDAVSGPPEPSADLQALARTFVGSLSKDHAYVPPAPAQRTAFAAALGRVLDGAEAADDLAALGYAASRRVDSATGRAFVEVAEPSPTGRGWGVVYVDASAPIHRVVEVPHPIADLHTELLAVEVFRRLPGAVLLISGTHRKAGTGGAGDAAHRTDHMFDALAGELTRRRVPAVQIHGFHDDTVPDTDIVVSAGATSPDAAAHRTAAALSATGLRTCRVWSNEDHACQRLAGRTNIQGQAAADAGLPFLHIECNRTLRDDPATRRTTATALAEALSPAQAEQSLP
ncbi:hypothetical protein LO772_01510 [Yinghuangia sp. ASG 101]|uniref:hypothetical protein n=1 Tax=Yinghuangia sp. ASG 101 TaxID=2896848 RepID=UPI001E45CDC9|nr:hypothetical protein [Yinghuangia sp. ASG 101]UGQ12316.1 hypothetical protein LO772_01510 [Yinghuangia sp. ASG 101]